VRDIAPFGAADLAELDERFLAVATRVVAIEDVYDGASAANVIGLRHDCDAGHSLQTAVRMAAWEADRGYRSTYFLLHTSPYWLDAGFEQAVEQIAGYGHEIGIHTNALAESLRTGEHPDIILETAIARLRSLGYQVRGTAGHGDPSCLRERAKDEALFANDEQFLECRRPKHGDQDRILKRGSITRKLAPRPLADFGLEYEALFLGLPWPFRFADSGGRWLTPGFDKTADRFAAHAHVDTAPQAPTDPLQLHLLIHPDWWENAFQ